MFVTNFCLYAPQLVVFAKETWYISDKTKPNWRLLLWRELKHGDCGGGETLEPRFRLRSTGWWPSSWAQLDHFQIDSNSAVVWAMVVAQLVERSLPTLKVRGSKIVHIYAYYLISKTIQLGKNGPWWGLVVTVLSFYSEAPSSNLDKVYLFEAVDGPLQCEGKKLASFKTLWSNIGSL